MRVCEFGNCGCGCVAVFEEFFAGCKGALGGAFAVVVVEWCGGCELEEEE